ncbi:MAG: hypothetical protein ACK4MD_04540 [Demequina sp.]
MSTDRSTLIPRLAGFVAGAAACAGLAWIAYATGHDSMAKGAIQGGSVTLAVIVVLWLVGRRAGMAGRVFNGAFDERDDRILTHAFADSSVAMGVAAIGCLIGAFYGLPGEGVAAIVLTVGMLTVLVSSVIRARRS